MERAGFVRDIKNALYVVQVNPPDGPVKVGRAVNPWRRWCNLMASWPFEYDVQVWALVPNAQRCETRMLALLRKHHIRGEWFTASDDLLETVRRATTALHRLRLNRLT